MIQGNEENRVPDGEPEEIDFEPEDELGSVGAVQAKLKKLKEELEKTKKERQEYLDGWQRCKADSINAKKEALQAAERAGVRAQEHLIESIIPVVDSFDMAIESDAWNTVDKQWRIGVESIRSQLISALESAGASHFGTLGEQFDPERHEILEERDGDGKSGTVVRVVRRGWKVRDRTIRPAHVIVVR